MKKKQLSSKKVSHKYKKSREKSCAIGPYYAEERCEKAARIREKAAELREDRETEHPCNGDEKAFSNKIATFSKALPHNDLGEVDLTAYKAFMKALKKGKPDYFEEIPMGGDMKLANPQGAYAFDLIGPDSHELNIAVPPSFTSAEEASEMVEVYWQALTRDVPFTDYETNPLIQAAAADLSNLSNFHGPKVDGKVCPSTLFRGNTAGDLAGPYISQFLWKDVPYGSTTIIQKYRTSVAGDDYMVSYKEWLAVQNGSSPTKPNDFDPEARYIRCGRDLAEYVHVDYTFQGCLNACLILLSLGKGALSSSNPYLNSATQGGFVTFGAAHILDLMAKSARIALESAWFQKFLVHRRLRPEEFGGRVHNHMTGAANYPIHSVLLRSQAVSEVYNKFGTYLLPMSYPEGCPTHPAYPAGHACIVGAGVTVLKAFYNESFVISNPVEASADGLELLPYSGEPLTVGGELNKLASNIALGRDTAGVHWRSDGIEGLKLGEEVAIEILRDYRKTYNEEFSGFSITKFNGSKITI